MCDHQPTTDQRALRFQRRARRDHSRLDHRSVDRLVAMAAEVSALVEELARNRAALRLLKPRHTPETR